MDSQLQEFNIFDIFLKWRRFIYRFVGIGSLITVVGVLFIPNEYITFSTVKGSSSSGFDLGKLMQSSSGSSALGSIAELAGSSSGGQVDYLVSLLNTKTVQDSMIIRFNLKDYYECKKIEDAREELATNTVINKNMQAEVLSIGVYHKDPLVALDMTRSYIIYLNAIYTTVNQQTGRSNREHLENRYKETNQQLRIFEDSLKHFQQKYGLYDYYSQTSAAIKVAAELKSQVILKEVELGSAKKLYDANSIELKKISTELSLLNGKINEMFVGSSTEAAPSIFIPFKSTPEIGLTYLRLYRNVQIYTELSKILVPMLEQASLQEKRESPSIVIVDDATKPEKKGRPKRAIIVIFVFFGLLSISSIYIFLSEHLNNIKIHNPLRFKQLKHFSETLKGDVRQIFKKKDNS